MGARPGASSEGGRCALLRPEPTAASLRPGPPAPGHSLCCRCPHAAPSSRTLTVCGTQSQSTRRHGCGSSAGTEAPRRGARGRGQLLAAAQGGCATGWRAPEQGAGCGADGLPWTPFPQSDGPALPRLRRERERAHPSGPSSRPEEEGAPGPAWGEPSGCWPRALLSQWPGLGGWSQTRRDPAENAPSSTPSTRPRPHGGHTTGRALLVQRRLLWVSEVSARRHVGTRQGRPGPLGGAAHAHDALGRLSGASRGACGSVSACEASFSPFAGKGPQQHRAAGPSVRLSGVWGGASFDQPREGEGRVWHKCHRGPRRVQCSVDAAVAGDGAQRTRRGVSVGAPRGAVSCALGAERLGEGRAPPLDSSAPP